MAATPSYLRDNQPSTALFPLYSGSTSAVSGNAASMLLAESSTVKYGGFQCIRKGALYMPPQKLELTNWSVSTDTIVKMFYYADADGASLGAAKTIVTAGYLDSGCYENVNYVAGTPNTSTSPGLVVIPAAGTQTQGNQIPSRVYFRGAYAITDVGVTG